MSKGNVLVVDDNSTIRAMARKALEEVGYSVVEAQNGAIGVEQAADNDLKLILADINMPVMGGLDMVRAIRSSDKHAENADPDSLHRKYQGDDEARQRGRGQRLDGQALRAGTPLDDRRQTRRLS